MACDIRSLTRDHLDQVVRVHRCAFPDFFLSFLGPRFLREFYASFLVDPMGRGFVAVDEGGRVLGVVVGPLNPAEYFKRLLKRRWWAVLSDQRFGGAAIGRIRFARLFAGVWCFR